MGRATQGVRLINLEKRNDEIASVCKVMSEVIPDEVIEELTEEITHETNTDDKIIVKPVNEDSIIDDDDDSESEIEENTED